jgi:hypothetical protein
MKVKLILSNVFEFSREFGEFNYIRNVIAIERKMLVFKFSAKLEYIRQNQLNLHYLIGWLLMILNDSKNFRYLLISDQNLTRSSGVNRKTGQKVLITIIFHFDKLKVPLLVRSYYLYTFRFLDLIWWPSFRLLNSRTCFASNGQNSTGRVQFDNLTIDNCRTTGKIS